MEYIVYIICIISLCFSFYILYTENVKHRPLLKKYQELQKNIQNLEQKENQIKEEIKNETIHLAQQKQNNEKELREEMEEQTAALNAWTQEQKEIRQQELNEQYDKLKEEKESQIHLQYQQWENQFTQWKERSEHDCKIIINAHEETIQQLCEDVKFQQNKYNALLEPLRQYEKDTQAKLFYTIQVPDEYKEDIQFLITDVSQKIKHPDIINKLVWSEYVKPYIEDTFKRANIKNESGIYKITYIDSGKSYIGKSTDIKKRITDHFKSSIGITSIADQMVHHEIWKTGFWNWTIEPIIYCEKDKLNELEKYYIDFFKTQEWGYNKKAGG